MATDSNVKITIEYKVIGQKAINQAKKDIGGLGKTVNESQASMNRSFTAISGNMVNLEHTAGKPVPYSLTFKNNIFLSIEAATPTNRWVRFLGDVDIDNTSNNWTNNMWWRGVAVAGDERWWVEDAFISWAT